MQRKAAIARFFFEFDALGKVALPAVLQSLSQDPVLVSQATGLLEVDALLKLIVRMAFARGIPEARMGQLQSVLRRADQLQRQYLLISQSLPAHESPLPEMYAGSLSTEEMGATAEPATIVVPREGKKILSPSIIGIQRSTKEAVDLQRELRIIAEGLEAVIHSPR